MIAGNFHGQLAKLHQQLTAYFNDEEVRTLCFDFGIDYDSLPAQGKEGKAREFISQLVHTGRMAEFTDKCRQLRPNVPWEFTFGVSSTNPTDVLDEMFREATRYHVMGDLGYALQLYRQLQRVAPTYPRIDVTIATVERELHTPYVDQHGHVRQDRVMARPAPMPAPAPAKPRARTSYGYFVGIGIAVIVLAIVVLVYLWLRSMGG